MRDQLGSLVDVVERLIDAFEATQIPYALGGAIAYSAWAEPRATRDIDLNIWLDMEHFEPAFRLLEACGVTLDRPAALQAARERGMFVVRHGEYRIDVFVPSVPFYAEALARRQRVRMVDRDTWVLSAESLAVFKMLFHRPKDIADVGRLIEIRGDVFDVDFVRRSLVDMLGEDEERIASWDRLVHEHRR
ncbi:MAG: hypothetical protein HYR72_03840 [Deltaproteobacteria bacterium]|nr:hypothetical protein [Deltaproteobacteria bacterium]MBI3388681.1 hypothetical protein [Deltaproteobacteria bacterium]